MRDISDIFVENLISTKKVLCCVWKNDLKKLKKSKKMALLGGLVHSFTIPETRRLQKFTVFKIQMISVPRNTQLFNSLVKISIWKRFSEFRSLESSLSKTYKSYNLKQYFKSDSSYFKRYHFRIFQCYLIF